MGGTAEKMTSPCRICYDDASTTTNPLLNPCDCKGSAAAIHKQCLAKWMRVSLKNTCEICQAMYEIDGIEPEPLLPLRYAYLANTFLCFYTSLIAFGALTFYDTVEITDMLNGFSLQSFVKYRNVFYIVTDAIPFLVFLNMGLLVAVLFPVFYAIRNKMRYMRYAFSVQRSAYFIVMLISIVACFSHPFAGSFIASHALGILYGVHRDIVKEINADLGSAAAVEG